MASSNSKSSSSSAKFDVFIIYVINSAVLPCSVFADIPDTENPFSSVLEIGVDSFLASGSGL